MPEEEIASVNGQDGEQTAESNGGVQEQAPESKGNTLMAKLGGEGDGKEGEKDGQDADKEQDKGEKDPADKVPEKPDGYELKFGEETQVDTELLADFQKAAHELGIPQGQAQKLAEMYEAYAAKAEERAVASQQKALDTAAANWEAEIEKTPTFTQDREHIRSALRQYGDQELYDLLNQTNLGSHPKMWAFMAKVGKALAEPGFHGQNSTKERSAADVLYPNQGK